MYVFKFKSFCLHIDCRKFASSYTLQSLFPYFFILTIRIASGYRQHKNLTTVVFKSKRSNCLRPQKAGSQGLPGTGAQWYHRKACLLLISFARFGIRLASPGLKDGCCAYGHVSVMLIQRRKSTKLSPREPSSFVQEGPPQGHLPAFHHSTPLATRIGDYFRLPNSWFYNRKRQEEEFWISLSSQTQGLQHMVRLFEVF